MKYIKDPDRLSSVVKILATYETETKQYYLSHLGPRVIKLGNVNDRLRVLFIIANMQRERRGIGKSSEKLKKAAAHFYQGVDGKVKECKMIEPQQAHQIFLEWLCDIKGMKQKTANLFLKWLAMFGNDFELTSLDWQAWKPYLHVPLDIWVMRLMGQKYLDVCTQDYKQDFLKDERKLNYVTPGLKSKKYIQLQQELAEVALLAREPRIALDVLWFIGRMYCNYHPLLCETCWLSKKCSNYTPAPDWPNVLTQSKSREREARRKAKQELIERYRDEFNELVEKYKERF